jgi:hypothetical protein
VHGGQSRGPSSQGSSISRGGSSFLRRELTRPNLPVRAGRSVPPASG